jgi:site-specific recombinase XerC
VDPDTALARQAFLATVAPDSRAAYASDLAIYLGWCEGQRLAPSAVKHDDVVRFRTWLDKTPAAKTGQVREPRTIAHILATVTAWHSHVTPADNPASGVPRPRWSRKATRTPIVTALNGPALCELAPLAAPSNWAPACAQLAMHLRFTVRARLTEICRANVEDLRRDDAGRVVLLQTRGRHPRVLTITSPVADVVEAWLAQRPPDDQERALLVDRRGRRIAPHQITYLTRTLAGHDRAGD